VTDEDFDPIIYLPPEQLKPMQARKNQLMATSLSMLAGNIPVYIDNTVPADEVRFVQDGRIVGRIVDIGKAK
jgi:hypothetical protein